MIRLSIIILSYNTADFLKKTLASVQRVMQADWEVLVVDNDSTDGSPEMVAERFPFVKVIKNNKNLGFAAGNNVGLKKARGQYVMLLNSDTELLSSSPIDPLLFYLDAVQEAAIASPKVVMADGRLDRASHRGFPTPWNAVTYFLGMEKLFGTVPVLNRVFGRYHQTWESLNAVHEIDACTAAAMCVRAKAIDEVGLLDEQFFMYGEDLDWCYRFKKAGWKIVFIPTVRVLHHKNKSGINRTVQHVHEQQIRTRAKSQFFDTMIQFYEKHYVSAYPLWLRHFVHNGIRLVRILKGA